MSVTSTVGGLFIGSVAMVAGIAAVETYPEPTSAIVICEDYVQGVGSDLAALMKRALKLEGDTIRFVESLGHDVAQIGDALGYFGGVHAGLGQTARALQGLHAAAHEAEKRLLSPTEERSGPGDKDPPPKT